MMPWWGYLLCTLSVWFCGLLTGRALGRSEVLSQLLVTRQMGAALDPLSMGAQRRQRDAQGPQPPG